MAYEILNFQVLKEMKVPETYKENGFIYVLANACMPGIYKMGMTTNSPEQRAKEISSSTGVPAPFTVVAAFHSKNPAQDERMVHEGWAKHRVNQGREFFRLTDGELSDALLELGTIIGPERNGDVSELATYDAFISFCRETDLDLNEELIDQGLGSVVGHSAAVRNFLIRAGIDYAKQLISQYNSSIVINPDGSVVMVKSLEAQFLEAEGENELS